MPDASIEENQSVATVTTIYNPRRFWWFKLIGVGTLPLFIGLIVAHIVIQHLTEAKLQNLIEQYREAGEPVHPKDYNKILPIPDEVNSALLYKKACLAFTLPATIAPGFKLDDFMDPSFIETHMEEARRIINANKATFDAIRKAGTLPEAHWQQQPFKSPLLDTIYPHLSDCRQLSKMLYVSVLFENKSGNRTRALENVNDILLLSEGIRKMQGNLLVYLVANSCSTKALEAIEIAAQNWHFKETPTSDGYLAESIPSEKAEFIISELLDMTGINESWAAAIRFERATLMDIASRLFQGKFNFKANSRFEIIFKPHWLVDQCRLTEELSAFAKAPATTGFDDVCKLIPPAPPRGSVIAIRTKPIRYFLLPAFKRSVEIHYQLIADRRMAATAIAIRLYESQNGRLPHRLSELVPDYLPAVPIDPFSPTGAPIGYLPEAQRPRLYSVNIDCTDDNGEYENKGSSDYRNNLDRPFFLDGKPRETSTTLKRTSRITQ